MKIGLVLPALPAYSETFFTNKIKGLEAQGHSVVLFINKKDNDNGGFSNIKYAPNISKNNLQTIIISLFRLLGAIFFSFNASRKLFTLDKKDNISFKQRIKNIIDSSHILSESVDWLHFGFGTMVFNKENVAGAIGAKMAVSFRGFDIGVYPLKKPNCYSILWKKVDKIHVISDDIKKLLFLHGYCGNAKVVKITPAINTAFFTREQTPTFSNNNFITVARLHWKKGLVATLEALALIKKEGISFHYTIIGEGVALERLKFAVYQLDLENEVTFMGKLPHQKIKENLLASDIYLQYSLQEGFCNAVLEAQALGLLCVVSDAEGLSENVLHNQTGWVVPRNNPKELASKIIEVIKLPKELKQQISQNAQDRVNKVFNLTKQQQAFLRFYEEE